MRYSYITFSLDLGENNVRQSYIFDWIDSCECKAPKVSCNLVSKNESGNHCFKTKKCSTDQN